MTGMSDTFLKRNAQKNNIPSDSLINSRQWSQGIFCEESSGKNIFNVFRIFPDKISATSSTFRAFKKLHTCTIRLYMLKKRSTT
jgi:hypothetical protein